MSIDRPAYRQPWTFGAKAYAEADTFEALAKGMSRKRSTQYVKMPTAYLAEHGLTCAACGRGIADDYEVNPGEGDFRPAEDSVTVVYHPKTKAISTHHYYCGWGLLMGEVFRLADILNGR